MQQNAAAAAAAAATKRGKDLAASKKVTAVGIGDEAGCGRS